MTVASFHRIFARNDRDERVVECGCCLLRCVSPLLAQSGHHSCRSMSAFGGKADISQKRLFALVSIFKFSRCQKWPQTPRGGPSSCPPVELATWPSDDHCSRLVFITKKPSGSPGARAIRRGGDVDRRRNRPETLIVATSLTIASC